jgi:hypothetical protein
MPENKKFQQNALAYFLPLYCNLASDGSIFEEENTNSCLTEMFETFSTKIKSISFILFGVPRISRP